MKRLVGRTFMGDAMDFRKSTTKDLSRRNFVKASVALAISASTSQRARADDFDRPPVFSNGRHQFEILMPRRFLPDIALLDLHGKTTKLAAGPGRILLVNLWATWCAACRTELPMLEKTQAVLHDRVSVIAISTDRPKASDVSAYLKSLGVERLVVLNDYEGHLSKPLPGADPWFPLYGIPITYLITPSGWIAGSISGASDWLSPAGRRLFEYYASA